ncbi:Clavaminate synthase-like protein [Hortaea werneckii]|uniref:Fe2OG dioxygenase domain-containing protein n=1 Tax=Hortaea werneckii TaxID=91943 RepID=A0A3M7CS33_HORWE|nr:Clavaminate synthase-like protein [Hortaea werneckii]KAI7558299.1 Clavaminate synthase-like protein [Hortaea werneckii]KAI7599977.1 Clavaminate synthase-like protein [Hortaea werneckii]KAI7605940.1 Clavaminate synthase-like protein [Hortaea werneckii]KAI7641859.1 Clavaminate synthase-like protein [Hortaea werneckii]
MPAATKYAERSIPRISLADFSNRIDEVTTQLVHAAETDGFFSLTDTGISIDEIEAIFRASESFFDLPDDVKATVPFTHKNVGWEKKSQIRPSTGFPDQKESYQLQFGANMADKWISPAYLPSFQSDAKAFMHKAQSLSEKLMLCFARGLGFPDDYFIKAHDISRPDCQSVLRLLHYFAVDRSAGPLPETFYRAGAHADWDLLTLLFQRPGQSGLEICPGREAVTNFGMGDTWTKIDFAPGDIVCNIGDLLMSWSDDRFKSTFHRVKAPSEEGDYFGPRYSIAFFNQPCTDCEIQGPKGKYPKVTGAEFTKAAMERNFAALKAKKVEMASKQQADRANAQVGVVS